MTIYGQFFGHPWHLELYSEAGVGNAVVCGGIVEGGKCQGRQARVSRQIAVAPLSTEYHTRKYYWCVFVELRSRVLACMGLD